MDNLQKLYKKIKSKRQDYILIIRQLRKFPTDKKLLRKKSQLTGELLSMKIERRKYE